MEIVVLGRESQTSSEAFINQVINEYDVVDNADISALNKTVEKSIELLNKIANAEEVYCEMPFCYKKDDATICDGVIDLVYKDNTGWHIIDYKTNFDERYLDIKYENQLNAYKDALKRILSVDATAEIYHIPV